MDKWKEGIDENFWFQSDRSNYVHVRVKTDKSSVPWKGQKAELYIAFARYADDEQRRSWVKLQTNVRENWADLEKDQETGYTLAKSPFLIPQMFPGDYVIIAEVSGKNDQNTPQQFPIGCHSTPPYVWEDTHFFQSDEVQDIKITINGGIWSWGEWRFLSNDQVQTGTVSEQGDLQLHMGEKESGTFILTICAGSVDELRDLSVEYQTGG